MVTLTHSLRDNLGAYEHTCISFFILVRDRDRLLTLTCAPTGNAGDNVSSPVKRDQPMVGLNASLCMNFLLKCGGHPPVPMMAHLVATEGTAHHLTPQPPSKQKKFQFWIHCSHLAILPLEARMKSLYAKQLTDRRVRLPARVPDLASPSRPPCLCFCGLQKLKLKGREEKDSTDGRMEGAKTSRAGRSGWKKVVRSSRKGLAFWRAHQDSIEKEQVSQSTLVATNTQNSSSAFSVS